MSNIPEGIYTFIHYGYDDEHRPSLSLLRDGDESFVHLSPQGKALTLTFDTDKRYCNGWHDLATAGSFPCPEAAVLPDQYDQCRHCQQKTGFNPAFYNANSVSEQQQARNAQPHLLYLAHFAPGVIKVGITWADRGIKRLLDQGARSGIIIKTYPNADIARQYEAKIAALPGIAEALQVRNKMSYLTRPYDATAGVEELRSARERLIREVGVAPDDNQPVHLDPYYIGNAALQPQNIIDVAKNKSISGDCIGMIGSVLIANQDDMQYALPLSKLTGYQLSLSYDTTKNEAAPHQVSLF